MAKNLIKNLVVVAVLQNLSLLTHHFPTLYKSA